MSKKSKYKEYSLKVSFLLMTVIPIIAMGIIIALFSSNRFRESIETEVQDNMVNMAYVLTNTLDKMYPGDYSLAKSDKYAALKKGDSFLDINEYLEHLREDTGMEITVFYGGTRMITTLADSEGEDMEGTTINSAIEKDVIKQDQARFYSSVKAGNIEYFAYYLPLHNSDNSVVGMIAILKDSKSVNRLVRDAVFPIYIISTVVTLIAGCISVMYSRQIINYIGVIKKYLISIKKQSQERHLDERLLSRKDELGEMANTAVEVNKAIKKLTYHDELTGIYNRRYAILKLEKIISDARTEGTVFDVAIADIDFFKKVNDTYGHTAGDIVLKSFSSLIERHMTGKGFVARWGGEEFMLVYDKCGLSEAERDLNELCKKIRQNDIIYKDEIIRITASFGVAEGTGMDLEEVIKSADDRLYTAKENGRNRVVAS